MFIYNIFLYFSAVYETQTEFMFRINLSYSNPEVPKLFFSVTYFWNENLL